MYPILTEQTLPLFLENSRKEIPISNPIAVMLRPSEDFNGMGIISTVTFSQMVHSVIRDGYRLFDHTMRNANLDEALDSLALTNKVNLLILQGHGDGLGIILAQGTEGRLDVEDIPKLRLESLAERVHICFQTCYAASDITPAFQKKLPEAQIWSAEGMVKGCFYIPGERTPRFLMENDGDLIVPHLDHTFHLEAWTREIADTPAIKYREALLLADKINNLRPLKEYAEIGDVHAQIELASRLPTSSPERKKWIHSAYAKGGYLRLLNWIIDLLQEGFLDLYESTCLTAFGRRLSVIELDPYIGKGNFHVSAEYLKALIASQEDLRDDSYDEEDPRLL
jgi:hypothetical protein